VMNAVEWGGQLDPSHKVRITCVRTDRMLMYRIADPGPGFSFENLDHAAIAHDNPIDHILVRDAKGLRAGGFGVLTARARGATSAPRSAAFELRRPRLRFSARYLTRCRTVIPALFNAPRAAARTHVCVTKRSEHTVMITKTRCAGLQPGVGLGTQRPHRR